MFYDLVKFINTSTKVTIICPKHSTFDQNAASHLAGRGCPGCNGDLSRELYSMKIDYFLKKSSHYAPPLSSEAVRVKDI